MPARDDLQTILVLGAGPIVIGQACEFDYSGTQAVKALKGCGYRVVLINSNPATIMTDPELADATYIEPLTVEMVEKVIARERPDAILPTVGGQTALNLAVALAERGALEQYNVELIGAKVEAVRTAENRQAFATAMRRANLPICAGGFARGLEDGEALLEEVGFPAILRPSFTLGGEGGGIAWNVEEFRDMLARGLDLSPVRQVLVERSVIGWKEFELEVMRDRADNAVVICSIENLDAMGVHTGDSITVAPAMTLTDREYQQMRNWAFAVIRAVGVETGGSNIQFAVHPETGEMLVVEMNPRVSRSSALASKATGFPIAKIAALLAVGMTLDEIPNDITRQTPASFEPTLDYVVVKIPRWDFAKFPRSEPLLTTSMKSVGETMALGANFKEALQKALRSLDVGIAGLEPAGEKVALDRERIIARLRAPTWDRVFYIREALGQGMSVEEAARLTRIDGWFIEQISQIVDCETELAQFGIDEVAPRLLRRAKSWGFSDEQIGRLVGVDPSAVRLRREAFDVRPVFNRVDTCAAEFEAFTPYLYSTYATKCEAEPTDRRKVLILGGGPIRIGQGIEFDDCCCQAAFALKELGIESILMNCNPETVSTDYDTSDRLYFEPLTLEDVLNVTEVERPEGIIAQFGGQTPLKLARFLEKAGARVLGTSPDAIDLAEDRERFGNLLDELKILQPENGLARSEEEALAVAQHMGYPVLLRPSYVLGGRAMVVAHDEEQLRRYVRHAVLASEDHPVLIDRFLEDAIEIDVDAVCDGQRVVIAGILQHIEGAGVHSGDSSAVLPPHTLTDVQLKTLRRYTADLALAIGVRGLINVQYAIKDKRIYVLEANPRASRTIPFISKATGIAWAKLAAKIMAGVSLLEQGVIREVTPGRVFVKDVVLPFNRFPEEDIILGPEMKSTGEVMGVDDEVGAAFAKARLAAGGTLPRDGTVFVSVNDHDKPGLLRVARDLDRLGFRLLATRGTAERLRAADLPVEAVYKVNEGRPNVVDHIKNGEIQLIINTPLGRASRFDEVALRRAAMRHRIPIVTTIAGAEAMVEGIRAVRTRPLEPAPLQA
jgi:carbamoyl-phosphate synthase large subunit